jgi:putative ABC transport system permease protein
MALLSRLLNHLRSNRLSRDIEREMRFHLDERADELIAAGMRPADARYEARRRFGNVAIESERTREGDIFVWLDELIRDLRYAVRSLRAAPAFTIVAILSLALGIGANTAIFSIINAVMLKSLPVSHPEELVMIGRTTRGKEASDLRLNPVFTNPLWEAIRDRQDMFQGAFAFGSTRFNLAAGGEARRVRADWVSGGMFTTLGVRPSVGRTILAADDFRGCPGVVVLGDAFWRTEYGGDVNVVGKTITLNGHTLPIVGVADARFLGVNVGYPPQLYVPLCAETIFEGPKALDRRSAWYLFIIARPKASVTPDQIRARFATLGSAIIEATIPPDWPADAIERYRRSVFVADPAATGFSGLRTEYSTALYMLMAIVGLVLAVACANVANLLLARGTARQHELAVRLALGAGRGRLVRQLITESLVLSAVGAALGSALAMWGSKLLVGLMSSAGQPVGLDLSADPTVMFFTMAVAIATALLFGLVPALRAGRTDPQTALKAQGRGFAEGHSRFRAGKALVAGQIALALVLVTGAGLLITSWWKLASLDPGFRRSGILLVRADMHELHIPEDQRVASFARILDRMRAVPGVRSASVSVLTPVGSMNWNELLRADGFAPKSDDDALAWANAVSDGFFATMGIPIASGRDFDTRDAATSTRVAVVSEAMARRFFGTPAAVGKHFEMQQGSGWSGPVEIVGVVGNTKYRTLRDSAEPIVYFPQAQQEAKSESRVFQLRIDGSPLAVASSVRAIIGETSSRISFDVTTIDKQLAESMVLSRVTGVLSGFFGALALLLAAIGLYGVMAYSVARRRTEIGVRIALGAASGRVVRLVLGEVGRIVIAGVIIGVVLSLGATRLVHSFLYGLKPTDPVVLGVAAMTLCAVGVVAALLPAWRAARMDPVAALREE